MQAPQATNALQFVAAGAGVTTVNTGTTLWLQSAALGLKELDLAGMDLRIDVSGSENELYIDDAVMDWHGVLDSEELLDIQVKVNAWNDGFVAPRVFLWQDGEGQLRLRGEVIRTWWHGHTVAQIDEYLRAVIATAMNLADWLSEQWPDAPQLRPEAAPSSNGVALTGDDRGLAATEQMAAQFITPGNPFGLARAETPAVTTDRIADLLAARSGQHSPVDDDGVLRIRWGQPAVDIAVHGDVLSISASAELMLTDPDDVPSGLLDITGKWSTNRAGAVAVVHRNPSGSTSVVYAKHLFVGTGMTDEQLEATVRHTCELVADCMMGMADEITG